MANRQCVRVLLDFFFVFSMSVYSFASPRACTLSDFTAELRNFGFHV